MKKTMTDEEVQDFVSHIWRAQTLDNPYVYLKAVRTTLIVLGYSSTWINKKLMPKIYKNQEFKESVKYFKEQEECFWNDLHVFKPEFEVLPQSNFYFMVANAVGEHNYSQDKNELKKEERERNE